MARLLAKVAGSVFGIGFIPFAPGTFGSLAAAMLYLYVPVLGRVEFLAPLVAAVTMAGVWAGREMEREYGKDPSAVVIDELAGQWVALAALPSGPLAVLLAFVFFRVFDIAKPGPVDRAQELPHGWGIMADDLLAGLFANVAVRLTMTLFPFLPYGA
jgi:phosphatidylglycerophosphatase A